MKIILIIIIIVLYNGVMVLKKRKEWDNYKKIPLKIKIFNLGSSHGEFSFNYKKIENGVNLGNESQTFYYDLKEVINYLNRIENKAVCFLPISYFSFSERKYWKSIDKIKYLKELKFSLIDKEDKNEAFIMRYLPIIYSIIKKIRKKKKILEKDKTIDERIEGHVKICQNVEDKITTENLEKLIKKLKEKNIRIILITTPFRKYYNDYFSKELLEEKFYKYINLVKEKYNLEYYDFSHSYDIFEKDEYFNDFDHLSEKGSERFMKEIEKIIKKR